jgi:hypothetical protein
MRRHLLVGILLALLVSACEEEPRKQQITFPKDFLDTQACQAKCHNNNKVALAQGEVCLSQCEIAYQRALGECDPLAGKDGTRWKACRLQALDKYAACQDTCTAGVQRLTHAYDECMKQCQTASEEE